jgi:hypothetical protein
MSEMTFEEDVLERSRMPSAGAFSGMNVPDSAVAAASDDVSAAAVGSIGVIPFSFEFKKRNQTGTPSPGSTHEQSTVVSIPSGSGFFITLNYIDGGFVENNFNTLRERPLGQFFVSVGLRGNNLVCRVRLTDVNSDDPIIVRVSGTLVTFR